jgi:LysR family hydrogen peroxide-inducible transcriptional activator
MNLRDLKYIIAVAETHHFGKAAARCFVSQPTLSGQVKKLEDELGVAIFERSNRSVAITPIGAELLDRARQILEQADAMVQLAQAYQDPLAGKLRVGAIPTLSPYLAPLILRPLQRLYPQMRLVWSEETTDRLTERLHNHEIDAALLATTVDPQEFEVIELFDEPFWIAHPSNHPFYLKDKISRADLECHLGQREQQGEHADLQAASLETLLQLVGAGFGSTLVPALAMRGSWTTGSGVVARQLDFRDAYRRVSLVFRKSFPRKSALSAFAGVVLQNLPNTVFALKNGKRVKVKSQ